ncbi:MAG: FAD-dependent oxidoreductase [Thermomicrobiales bacterium]
MTMSQLPVVVIGAGPVGLAAAAHLVEKGETPLVIERGDQVGASLLDWGHVKLFTPWRYAVDEAAVRLLSAYGWESPEGESFPTGGELARHYLQPLAAIPELQPNIRLGARVISVTRDGYDKMKSPGRNGVPFLVTFEQTDGSRDQVRAKAVIDASGTYLKPNPLGASGAPAIGEEAVSDRVYYGIPDPLGVDRVRYAGKRVLVVGSGHSAFNVILDLIDLADADRETSVVWAVRRSGRRLELLFGGGAADALPARGELGRRVKAMVESGRLQLVTGFNIARITDTAEGLIVAGQDNVLPAVDEIVATTGFRPDLSMLSELRLNLDSTVESPAALAPMIDPNLHSCGSVPPHGAFELKHPEDNFYIAGMKSYGRAPTFLMLTGYEQVRSIACAITGDETGARDVRLVLPETGVCTSSILEERGVACCAPAVESTEACGCGETVTAEGGCCSSTVPQLIQLQVATKGSCC